MTHAAFHTHTMYSLLDGFSTPEEYLARATEIGLSGFCITEHGNEYSWVYFDKIKHKFPNIKMMYGVELYETFDVKIKDKDSRYFHLVAIAKNEKGRIALNEIVTKSNFEGFYYKPRVDLNMLKPYAQDIIITSACMGSKLGREEDYNKCLEYVMECKSIFPYYFLEIQSHKNIYDENGNVKRDSESYNKKIFQLANDTNTPFIITCDSHAATKEDLYYQQRLVQIAHDDETLNENYEGCYMQTNDEIHETLDFQIGYENVEIGLKNTLVLMNLVEEVNMPFQEPQLPTFPLPEGFENNHEYLKHLAQEGWKKRKINNMSDNEVATRKERLEYELSVIHQMNYDGYFIIVWDFINYAKSNGIMVGAGRGSAGGSLVCYLLGITELDPLKYGLIFERFLNPERVSMPDIDLDFSDRDKIIEYLMGKYGENNVCQIINFSYITPVVAIKDVARILGIPYNVSDKISKKFTYPTFQECIDNNPDLYEKYVQYDELFKIASKISGRVRQASIHAGGIGIVDSNITDYMAMKVGSKGERVIQVDKKKVEEVGIIKFDILGLATLVMMKEIMEDLKLDPWVIDPNNPEFLADKYSYKILQQARTNAVFQVESSGMRDLLKKMNPTNLEDVSAVLALFRPDSMGMLEQYIENKHNPNNITYLHEDMKSIFEMTQGCMIYQEQIMDIVRKFGGRTYGGADKFRKAIGKKDIELVKKESDYLYKEIISNGYSEKIAKTISDDMSNKGNYCFNKSHSMLYSVITLQTAYLKAHYPVHFFKALLNLNKDDYGALNKYIIDAKDFGVEILNPHINRSDRNFSIHNNKILFGLQAIKGIGEKFVEQILEERLNGKFEGFENLSERLPLTKTQVIALVKSGAIPTKDKNGFFANYAKSLFTQGEYEDVVGLPTLKVLKEKWGIDTDVVKNKEDRLKLYNNARKIEFEKTKKEKFANHMNEFYEKYLQNEDFWEFETLSIFINSNPFEKAYEYITPFEDIENGAKGVVVGIISNVTKKKDRHGKQFAFLSVYSAYGLYDLTCWHSQFKDYQDQLKRGSKLAFLCKKNDDKAVIESIKTYEKWLEDKKITL